MAGPIYLDHHATTPLDPAVADAMRPWLDGLFGNAGSTVHGFGLRAKAAVDVARAQVAAAVGADPDDVLFTSGATEADNLAILGLADAVGTPGHVVTVATEHKAVLEPVRALAARGWRTTELVPDATGLVTPNQVEAALADDTRLVSIMLVNNETGVIQPVTEIAERCRARGVLVHTDAVQALGKIAVDRDALGADLLCVSAHKIHGPQGIGALVVRRRGRPRVALTARQLGGGQERGLRPGTVPVMLTVGFGVAAERAAADVASGGPDRVRVLRDALWDHLRAEGGVHLHGSWTHRVAHNLNLRFDGVPSKELFRALRATVACSAGSACSTGKPKPSHVLTAMGVDEADAWGAVRLGLGRSTTAEEVDRAGAAIVEAVRRIRAAGSETTSTP